MLIWVSDPEARSLRCRVQCAVSRDKDQAINATGCSQGDGQLHSVTPTQPMHPGQLRGILGGRVGDAEEQIDSRAVSIEARQKLRRTPGGWTWQGRTSHDGRTDLGTREAGDIADNPGQHQAIDPRAACFENVAFDERTGIEEVRCHVQRRSSSSIWEIGSPSTVTGSNGDSRLRSGTRTSGIRPSASSRRWVSISEIGPA